MWGPETRGSACLEHSGLWSWGLTWGYEPEPERLTSQPPRSSMGRQDVKFSSSWNPRQVPFEPRPVRTPRPRTLSHRCRERKPDQRLQLRDSPRNLPASLNTQIHASTAVLHPLLLACNHVFWKTFEFTFNKVLCFASYMNIHQDTNWHSQATFCSFFIYYQFQLSII